MSSKAYVLPVNPEAPTSSVADVDAGKLWAQIPLKKTPKAGTTHTFYPQAGVTSLVSLGEKFANKKGDDKREVVRRAVGGGVKDLKRLGNAVSEVVVDASEDPHAAAVAAHLAGYDFTLKTKPENSPFDPREYSGSGSAKQEGLKYKFSPLKADDLWTRGEVYARAQNTARTLMEMPANLMTPTIFANRATDLLDALPNTEVIVRDAGWAKRKGMNTFLSVAKGTNEPPQLVEIHYRGAQDNNAQPIAFVGKGITFDSGGISIKPASGMKLMRGDMGGAASLIGTMRAIAELKLPVNVVAICMLTENMPGPSANKPGDVVYAMNGQTVEIDNTDAEGRLVLADGLWYASTEFKAHTVIDVATLTGAMDTALGELYTGVFSTSDELWKQLYEAGETEYDRFWRMPLDEEYGPQIHSSNADLCNYGGKPAGACTAALFLKSHVKGIEGDEPSVRWAHIDIAGTMEFTRTHPYQEKGMTGRPVRALVEWVRRLSEAK
ncbi:leucine aminopeptidase [Coniophora puteana RWD-64-598 SS2]|uniref:leucyl aminopeptidase n=1 Tax=Coniophora puteana (strain RWD-64-598) TaxID=741705 RepID=A0A5M3N7K4_CONPW|nr:leucine aminopeptidase [Coniophora puteana RWD-64-598 SS2]EIW87422.1 leucine aminopeptidase [Coniophora puteana RWD-64-598 SS2]